MIGMLEYIITMLRILANEVEDLDDGEERIATPACALVRKDIEEVRG
ncbi:MAG: hypothetical protein IKO83_01380 [Oscillospiraceae bacterium]|nr:hypothetical protein [Oscillospiraceae bacterium]MBR7190509.1 hypothetical protein [Oscillospiraceae bacterium]